MIFKYFTNQGDKNYFKATVFILIFAFLNASCNFTSSEKVVIRPDNLPGDASYTILKAVMNDGIVIDLKNAQAVYAKKYQDKRDVIVYTTGDTTWVGAGVYNLTNVKTGFLELKDIQTLIIEKDEVNSGMIVAAIIGIVAVIAVVAIVVNGNDNNGNTGYHPSSGSGGEKYSCPFIYSYNGEKYIFDGEPYGGAITEGLKRTDYSDLQNLKLTDGKYKLLIRNETDETQHTDEMKLLVIDHPINTKAAADNNGNITVFEKAFSPVSARDENGKDLSVFFKSKDNVQWQTDMPNDKSSDRNTLRHELIFKYPKPKDAKSVKFLVNAGTSIWGEFMVKNMLDMKGNGVDKWYEGINRKGAERIEFHKFMEREEMYLLKVNVLENDKWVTRGSISNSGPYKDEDRIIELNTENVNGDTLCIKLTPPYGFWKFDYAGVIYESTIPSKITELPVSNAIDEKGFDVKALLSGTDGSYYSMPEMTNFAKIEFDAPAPDKSMKRSLFLKTTGYYNIHLKKDKPEQAELMEKIFSTPGLILEISMDEYFKRMQTMGFTDK
ncbi:MAG: hypothetical protein IPL53_14975 [Ignavibacteria bacterium]|nr:hypothetical protein [Ignavibacteria bacterium]